MSSGRDDPPSDQVHLETIGQRDPASPVAAGAGATGSLNGPDSRASLVIAARNISAAVAGGFMAGLLVGGVGGRLAMFLLRVTSDPALRGLSTDDDFTIGRFSGATMFLLILTAGLGMLGGLLYLIVRRWVPARLRPWAMGVFFGLLGGALVIRPGGIDFTLLSPLWLAIALFIALPALYGLSLVLLTERLLREDSVMHRRGVWVVGLLPLIPLLVIPLLGGNGLLAVLVVLVTLAAWAISQASPRLATVWRSAAVTWIGRVLLVVACSGALVELVRDTVEIL